MSSPFRRVIAVLPMLLGAGCRSSSAPHGGSSPPSPGAAPARGTHVPADKPAAKTEAARPLDPNAAFPVTSTGMFLDPPYAPPEFAALEATMSGSIHSPLAAGVFFKRPEFQ